MRMMMMRYCRMGLLLLPFSCHQLEVILASVWPPTRWDVCQTLQQNLLYLPGLNWFDAVKNLWWLQSSKEQNLIEMNSLSLQGTTEQTTPIGYLPMTPGEGHRQVGQLSYHLIMLSWQQLYIHNFKLSAQINILCYITVWTCIGSEGFKRFGDKDPHI